MIDELRTLIGHVSDWVELQFAAREKILSMWHVVMANGDQAIMPSPRIEDRDIAMELVRVIFLKRNVIRFVHIDEAWRIERPMAQEELARLRRDGTNGAADRREIINFWGEDHETGMLTAHRFIHRPERGKPFLDTLEYDVGFKIAEGRMTGLLPIKGTLQ